MKISDLRIECKSTLKKTSKDDSNNYMTNSDLQVIDFDCLKDKYIGKIEFNGLGVKSNDALFIIIILPRSLNFQKELLIGKKYPPNY